MRSERANCGKAAPKMSIRRHQVMKVYEDLIGHLYGDDPIEHEAADGAHKQEAA